LLTTKCDITNTESINECLKLVVDKYNKIDGLVSNAHPRTSDWGNKFEDIEYLSWQKNIEFQLNSYFYFTNR
jgi:NAD(P)-dependent dehydrogenase (short-subunit alcohol dehydrogenase family)